MRILDIDLDFFLNDVATFQPPGRRLEDSYIPHSEAEVRSFLECQCGLSTQKPIRGRQITNHHEAFFFWRDLLQRGLLTAPFEVVHVDAHADLGLGDSGYTYLMTEILHREVADRQDVAVGTDKMNLANYLAFAAGCRWLSKLVYVTHPSDPEDLIHVHMRDYDIKSGALQLKRCTSLQMDDALRRMTNPEYEALEPEIPLERILGPSFQNSQPFDFAVLCQSPQFTPTASDKLIPLIMEYIAPMQ